ncbi:hypothetical protein T439DRAFT_323389 [Meredithblackwellia eburnea MCA 4105]
MSPAPTPVTGSTVLTASTSSENDDKVQNEEQERLDLIALQAELDYSLNSARELVDSWIPKEWSQNSSNRPQDLSLADLQKKARLPGLGVGASATELHKIRAQEYKLRAQLVKADRGVKGKEAAEAEAVANGKNNKGKGKAEGDSDDEEEGSRASAFKSKLNPTVNGGSTPANGRQAKKDALPPVTSSSFYGGNSTSLPFSSATSTDGLSKNQRAKLKKQQAAEARKRLMEAEVAAEEEERERKRMKMASKDEEDGDLEKEDASFQAEEDLPFTSDDEHLHHRKLPRSQVRPPFAPLTSSSEGEMEPPDLPNGVTKQDSESEDEEGDGSTTEGTGSMRSSTIAPSKEGSPAFGAVNGGAGTAENWKKKKRKNKKKKKKKSVNGDGAISEEVPKVKAPILNLTPLP